MNAIKTADKYLAITRINLQNALAYFWDVAYRSIFMVIIMYVFVRLWSVTYSAAGRAIIAGYSLSDMIWYLVMAETIIIGKTRFVEKIGEEVKDGSLAYTMNRPYNYLLYHFFSGLGETVLRMAVTFVAGAVVTTWLVAPLTLSPLHLLPLLLIVALAITLDFCISAILGLMAFFTEDVTSFQFIYQKVLFILGGMMLPLDFFPAWLRNLSLALPFNFVVYAPARLFIRFDWGQFARVALMQTVWIAALALGLALLYRYGIRRLSINGG